MAEVPFLFGKKNFERILSLIQKKLEIRLPNAKAILLRVVRIVAILNVTFYKKYKVL